MDLISQNNIIDPILNSYKHELGNDFEQYRNHVYRVYNFAVPYVTSTPDIETLSVAAAFHDLAKLFFINLLKNPWKPLPMYKF
jgi:HD superfamily phosphohydrolase YqeK